MESGHIATTIWNSRDYKVKKATFEIDGTDNTNIQREWERKNIHIIEHLRLNILPETREIARNRFFLKILNK